MKKRLSICIIFAMLFVHSFAFSEYDLGVPDHTIVINGEILDNETSSYPFYMSKDVVYIPVTWKIQRTLGISLSDTDKGIVIKSGLGSLVFVNETSEKKEVLSSTGTQVDKKIRINNKIFDNSKTPYPFVYKDEILYMPLSDDIARNYLDFDVHVINDNVFINSGEKPKEKNLTVAELVNLSFTEEEMSIIDNAFSFKKKIEDLFDSDSSYFSLYGYKLYKTNENGIRYDGMLIGDKYKYVGQFYNKMFDGLGVIEYTNGIIYAGEFKEGRFHGIGRYYKGTAPMGGIQKFNAGISEGSNYNFLDFPPKYSKSNSTLIILTEFTDTKLSTTDLQWYNYMFGKKYSVGSFYKDISEDKINLVPAIEDSGTKNDGVIRVSVNMPHPNAKTEYEKVKEVHVKALAEIDKYIDFNVYDKNKNGIIDEEELIITNVIAGYEYPNKDNKPSINAFKSTSFRDDIIFDGVSVPTFMAVGELNQDPLVSMYAYQSTPSTGAHELGHIFGLPDLYDTDYSSDGIGYYGLMSAGTHLRLDNNVRGLTPVDFCAWSRIYLKLTEPTIVNQSGEYELYSKKTKRYNILKIPINDHEYFLLENKEFSLYDAPLSSINKNSGVLIWHIDEDVINSKYVTNSVNDDENLKGVDLEEANESIIGKSAIDTNSPVSECDPYYRTKKISSFNNNTTPSSKDNEGNDTGISIKIIKDGEVAKVLIEIDKK